LAEDGTYQWARRVDPSVEASYASAVAVGQDGSIFASGWESPGLWLARFDADGNLSPGWPITLGSAFSGLNGSQLVIDSGGNVVVTAYFKGTVTFATRPTPVSLVADASLDLGNLFAAKISPDGVPIWAIGLGPSYDNEGSTASPIAVDASG